MHLSGLPHSLTAHPAQSTSPSTDHHHRMGVVSLPFKSAPPKKTRGFPASGIAFAPPAIFIYSSSISSILFPFSFFSLYFFNAPKMSHFLLLLPPAVAALHPKRCNQRAARQIYPSPCVSDIGMRCVGIQKPPPPPVRGWAARNAVVDCIHW